MRKNTPVVSCSSANGDAATERIYRGDAKRASDEPPHRGEICDDWSEVADCVIEQYDEALRLLSK